MVGEWEERPNSSGCSRCISPSSGGSPRARWPTWSSPATSSRFPPEAPSSPTRCGSCPRAPLGRRGHPGRDRLPDATALERVFRGYDEVAGKAPADHAERPPGLQGSGMSAEDGVDSGQAISDAHQSEPTLSSASASTWPPPMTFRLAKMRPYALADAWGTDRRATLDLFLHATRAGMLDFSWQVLCPHCRGSKQGRSDLSGITSEDHCDSCGIDFSVNFDQSVELTFVPNPTLSQVVRVEYCLGGPQMTPHIVAQRSPRSRASSLCRRRPSRGPLPGPERRASRCSRPSGSRGTESAGHQDRRRPGPAPADEPVVAPDGILNVENAAPRSTAWSVIERDRLGRPGGDGRRRHLAPGLPRPLLA
jgi:hypothetical protein